MDIEHARKEARRLEDSQQWWEALDAYLALAGELEERGTPDPVVYGRIGELRIRTGDTPAAVEAWERAIEAYLLEGMSDQALAVCRKIVRYSPGHEELYLRMGQIRARQGLLIYARKHFLTYAETVGQRGDVDEAIRAMEELVSWVPSDLETRLFLADRLLDDGRRDKALVYLREGYWRALWEGDEEAMEKLRPRVLDLDPGADLDPGRPRDGGAAGEVARRPAAAAGDDAGSESARRDEGGIWARILEEELKRRAEPARTSARDANETGVKEARPEEEEASVVSEEAAPAPSEVEPIPVGPGGATAAPEPLRAGESIEADPEQPSGPSEFSRLLSKFREETASRPDEREARAQYERGLAERERGAPGRAIALFDRALTIREDFLPAYEMLGRCHLERKEPQIAIHKTKPALDLPVQVEDDLLGIFYTLGRAHEELGEFDEARNWYERVFAVDINYEDVIERLRHLR